MLTRFLLASVAKADDAVSPVSCSDVPAAAPIFGVVKAGEVASTLLPVPVFATLTRFLLASVAKADDAVSPVSCSDVPAAAPIFGVVKAGEVASTLLPVPVFATLTRFLLASVAKADDAVSPVSCSDVPAAAPILGVVRTGEVARTTLPLPDVLFHVGAPDPPLANT